jgi:hypothetical protein
VKQVVVEERPTGGKRRLWLGMQKEEDCSTQAEVVGMVGTWGGWESMEACSKENVDGVEVGRGETCLDVQVFAAAEIVAVFVVVDKM